MTVHVPDRFKAANAFWIGLGKIGLTPAAVLSQARLPLTVYDGKKNLVTTAQFFALWRAVGELSADPAAGLKIATEIDVGNRPPSTMAAYYARDYRDALTRLARFKQLCAPEKLQIKVSKDECMIEPVWLHAAIPNGQTLDHFGNPGETHPSPTESRGRPGYRPPSRPR